MALAPVSKNEEVELLLPDAGRVRRGFFDRDQNDVRVAAGTLAFRVPDEGRTWGLVEAVVNPGMERVNTSARIHTEQANDKPSPMMYFDTTREMALNKASDCCTFTVLSLMGRSAFSRFWAC